MSDFGKIKWEATVIDESPPLLEDDVFKSFLDYCKNKLPSQNLTKSYNEFVAEKNRLQQEFKKSIEAISQQPFLVAFLAWIKEIASMRLSEASTAKMLLTNNLIGIVNQDGQVWTLAHAKNFDHRHVVEAIRCQRDWSISLRENLAASYVSFIQWLSKATYGYINIIEDPDWLRSQERSMPYHLFITFLSKLNEEDQIIAKLLYFGGSKSLDDILNLQIEHIDFEKYLIYFDSQAVSYPLHVFADIKANIRERKKGRLFMGRRGINTPLNSATIFRNFKEAAVKMNLGQSFTPKSLTINK